MLDISFVELMVIGIVALVVIAPKDLPRVLRTVGGYAGKARRMASDFQRQLNDVLRDEEIESLQRQVSDLGKSTEIDLRRGLTVPPDNHVPTRRQVTVGEAGKLGSDARGPAMTPMPATPAPTPPPAAIPAEPVASGGIKP